MNPTSIAALIGLSAALAAWSLRAQLERQFRRDSDWVAKTAARFSPNPVDATAWTAGYYGLLAVLFLVLVAIMPNPLFAIVFWLLLLWVPKVIVEAMWQKRRRQVELQLPAAISSLANSIRAGLTLVQGIRRLSETAPEPIRSDFLVMANRYDLGGGLESTIIEARDRMQSQGFNLFASALLVNREMGGDAAETLGRISESLEKLHEMRKTIEAHTSEGRTNIKVLLIAPVGMLLMLSAVDSEGVKMLFTTPEGYGVLLVAGIFIGLGIYFSSKLTNQEV
jgi:tight adherence protein B